MFAVNFDSTGATVTWEGGSFHRPGATVLDNPQQYVPKGVLMGYREIGVYRYYTRRGVPPKAEDGFFPTKDDPWIMMKEIAPCSGREARSEKVSCCMQHFTYCTILDRKITIDECVGCKFAK